MKFHTMFCAFAKKAGATSQAQHAAEMAVGLMGVTTAIVTKSKTESACQSQSKKFAALWGSTNTCASNDSTAPAADSRHVATPSGK